MKDNSRLAIVGAGPAGLMVFKKLVACGCKQIEITVFESSSELGSGMPYSASGARTEHITNVSADELPDLVRSLDEWVLGLPEKDLSEFGLERDKFHEKRVVPRLLFGRYLKAQFELLISQARADGIKVTVHKTTKVVDVQQKSIDQIITVQLANGESLNFDFAVLCTGHQWRKGHEVDVEGYFDSPYPPEKLAKLFNHTVVVRGSSLTAIDAVKTITSSNGSFYWEGGRYCYRLNENASNLRLELHSRDGLLPSVRVHMEEPHIDDKSLISDKKIDENRRANSGFLQLDFLFDQGFKQPLAESDPAFYERVKDLSLEEFVDKMMSYREDKDPFELLRQEYKQSLKSIELEQPVPWKEMLASLSFAMNYPAKYLSAEDMLRLRKRLMPLISVVIAFIPQTSCETLLALQEAGCLTLISDGDGGEVSVTDDGKIIYEYTDTAGTEIKKECMTFIDCIGQRPFTVDEFPFLNLVRQGIICGARLKFQSNENAKKLLADGNKDIVREEDGYYLRVPGVSINDNFQVVDQGGRANPNLFLMAVPHIGGFNPDYSGLDFCEQASKRVVQTIVEDFAQIAK